MQRNTEKPMLLRQFLANQAMFRRVDEPGFLSRRLVNALKDWGFKNPEQNYEFFGQLVERPDAELLRIDNLGMKSLNEIKEAKVDFGLPMHSHIEITDRPDDAPLREILARGYDAAYGQDDEAQRMMAEAEELMHFLDAYRDPSFRKEIAPIVARYRAPRGPN